MSFFRYLFPRKSQVTIGSIWVHESDFENPFQHQVIRKVKDVKGKFVKFRTYGQYIGKYDRDDSCEIRTLYAFYRKLDNPPEWFKE
jgi:hypothetical protein